MRGQCVEIDLVVAAQFEILQTVAVAEGVVSQVEHVIGLVIRQMNLEQVQTPVNGVNQPELAGQQVKGSNAAVTHAVCSSGDFIMDVAGLEHGLVAVAESSFVEPPQRAACAVNRIDPSEIMIGV